MGKDRLVYLTRDKREGESWVCLHLKKPTFDEEAGSWSCSDCSHDLSACLSRAQELFGNTKFGLRPGGHKVVRITVVEEGEV